MDFGTSRNARIAQALTVFVLVAVTLGMALNGTGMVAAESDATAKLLQLIVTLPMLFYLVAIWTIHRAFAALARGEAMETVLARLLVRVGACLFLGGLLRVFAEPSLTRLVLDRPWPFANFDIAAITLGTVGLLLILLAAPLREAATMRAELAGIV